MGNMLDDLKERLQKTQLDFLGKIKFEYIQHSYGQFSLTNFNFFANQEEFEFIFGQEHQYLFSIYEKDSQGQSDVLEIFCGLILLSDDQLKNKIRFLFEIFDLNEKMYLQKDEVEFLIYKCFSSLYKVFNINQQLQQPLIEQFVSQQIENPIEQIHYKRLFDMIVNNNLFDKLCQNILQNKLSN